MTIFESARALIIGISAYRFIQPLPEIVLEDACSIRDTLTNPQYCGYPPGSVQLLLDEQASRADILNGLAGLAASCGPDSTVFLYFSGHGARILNGQPPAGEYLLPYDAQLSPSSGLLANGISTEEFSAALRSIQAQKMVVVLDCCHAGGIGQPKSFGQAQIKQGLSHEALELLGRGRGRAILASSRSDEVSWVLPGDSNSLFTRHLLAGLRGGISSPDGVVKIFDLFEFIQPRVTGDRPGQHPVFKAELESNFPIALAPPLKKDLPPASAAEDYDFDAYLVYAGSSAGGQGADAGYVWNTLVPFLKEAGIRLAVTGVSEDPGVGLVVGVERAITRSKRTVLVLSNAYLGREDHLTHFQAALAGAMSVLERQARVLPLIIEPIDTARLSPWLRSLWPLDLSDPYTGRANLERLPAVLKGPVPRG